MIYPPEGGERKERSDEEIATLEVSQFILYSIRHSKPELLVAGSRALRFDDREEFFDFFLANFGLQREKNKEFKAQDIEYFKVSHAIKRREKYWFYNRIDYLNEAGVSFGAKEGVYDSQAKIFDSIGEFEFHNQDGSFAGLNLHFDGDKQEFSAFSPKGKIWLENSL